MRDLILRWKYIRLGMSIRISTPVFLYPNLENIPIAQVLPDILHYHGIPCRAHLSASVEALQAAEANHHHDLVKDVRIGRQEPVLIVW